VFTGLVREVGTVRSLAGGRLVVGTTLAAGLGDSIAIDGVCLTVVAADAGTLAFEAVPETLARTALGELAAGRRVNLEPALRAGDPLGGHIVQGHVDGTGTVAAVSPEGISRVVEIDADPDLSRYLVEKGSVAVDGVSLTVSGLGAPDDPWFEVSLIPETLARTTLGHKQPGEVVNLEVDMIAKYVARLLGAPGGSADLVAGGPGRSQ